MSFAGHWEIDPASRYPSLTATPKAKTLQLFGRPPDPTCEPGTDNLPQPFHVYTMREAIEEGVILNVLRRYTTYNMAFRLEQQEAARDENGKQARNRGTLHAGLDEYVAEKTPIPA